MNILHTIETDWNIIKADVGGFLKKVLAGVVWLAHEAEIVIGWAARLDPAIGAALGVIVHEGELGAQTLANHSIQGLGNLVDGAASGIEQTLATLINNSGLAISGQTALTAFDVAMINKLRAMLHAAVDAAAPKILASLAPPAPPAPGA